MSLNVIKHPLILDKLTKMRCKNTDTKHFRENLDAITKLMIFEIFKNLELDEFEIETPVAKTTGYGLSKKINLFPILRAGLGMVNGFLDLLPNVNIGHIGMHRDEKTLEPVEYFFKNPDLNNSISVVLDPMLATGGSASLAIEKLEKITKNKIILVAIVGSPEGVDYIQKHHPKVDIYLASKDEKLNKKGYIVPGLGDAGDRIFGTK
ncbi:uracil phosphoribosyltransferase [Spiroplasma endosymbiont of Amphibalanus improvisus]|uniref:uracil phosphoribosyltransferase n=1 Tax=Spiroplasma endosymbiont of Amphibalanus improvisus TaxID=3066327 RepID=UPI00313BE84B